MAALNAILSRLTAFDGVRAVVVTGREGLPIDAAPAALDDADALAAFGMDALSAAAALGAETRRASLIGAILEYGDALISVEPLGEYAATVARLDSAAALVPLRQALRQMRGELLAALDAM
jgi:predicted regulator of Ras-like GTPase activity (Roadblock/LC7/MglB family)